MGWKAELAWLVDPQRTPYPRSGHTSTIDEGHMGESPPVRDRRPNHWSTAVSRHKPISYTNHCFVGFETILHVCSAPVQHWPVFYGNHRSQSIGVLHKVVPRLVLVRKFCRHHLPVCMHLTFVVIVLFLVRSWKLAVRNNRVSQAAGQRMKETEKISAKYQQWRFVSDSCRQTVQGAFSVICSAVTQKQ